MIMDLSLQRFVDSFSQFEEVEAIMLAGSRTTGSQDSASDYDIYIYSSSEIPLAKREKIAKEFFSYIELNNQFWETEDDGIFKENGIPVEVLYRSLEWLDQQLERVLIKCQAEVGYTTCFWSNLLNSVILFDRDGKAKALQEKYRIDYPKKLKLNIIEKNYPLLRQKMPAYYFQIEKALKRNDFISVNHRVAALFASYFDILFAVNEMPHPGEKKLVKILTEKAAKLPQSLENDIENIIKSISKCDNSMLDSLNTLLDHLDSLLHKENLIP